MAEKVTSKLLIIGDTIIDKNVFVEASGLSLESPTLKTTHKSENISFGGAANVAKFASLLGADVTFVTSIKDRKYVDIFKEKYNIDLILIPQEKTNTKTRFWVSRGDSTYKYLQINDTNTTKTNTTFDLDLKKYDVLAVSDYRCGLISNQMVHKISNSPVLSFAASQVSSRDNNFIKYKNFNHLVLNKKEAIQFSKKQDYCFDDFRCLNINGVYVTLGQDGCEFLSLGTRKKHKQKKISTSNTIGAGDSFYAALLVSRGDISFSNRFASYYVSKKIEDDIDIEQFFIQEAMRKV